MLWKYGVRTYSPGSLTMTKIVYREFYTSWCFVLVISTLMRIWDDFVLNFNIFRHLLHILISDVAELMCFGEDCSLDYRAFFIWWHRHDEPCWTTLGIDKVYSPLEKVTQSLRDLIVAIIESAKDDTHLGQPTLLSKFKMTQWISKIFICFYYFIIYYFIWSVLYYKCVSYMILIWILLV